MLTEHHPGAGANDGREPWLRVEPPTLTTDPAFIGQLSAAAGAAVARRRGRGPIIRVGVAVGASVLFLSGAAYAADRLAPEHPARPHVPVMTPGNPAASPSPSPLANEPSNRPPVPGHESRTEGSHPPSDVRQRRAANVPRTSEGNHQHGDSGNADDNSQGEATGDNSQGDNPTTDSGAGTGGDTGNQSGGDGSTSDNSGSSGDTSGETVSSTSSAHDGSQGDGG